MEFVAQTANQRRPAVGLTPLIDVVFILLIFFMLVVNFSSLQQTPLSNVMASEQPAAMDADTLVVKALGAGNCELGGQALACDAVPGALPDAGLVYLTYGADVRLDEIVRAQEILVGSGREVSLAVPEEAGTP